MTEAERELARRGVGVTWRSCAIGNDCAARFFEKCGWTRTGTMIDQSVVAGGTFPIETWRYEKTLAWQDAGVTSAKNLLRAVVSVEPSTFAEGFGGLAVASAQAVVASFYSVLAILSAERSVKATKVNVPLVQPPVGTVGAPMT
jgi:D-arabinose 1-dehydrogenase-like Zn-dependent alcohol dehydrogenase